jgi:sugar phosphate isomerase/epimerase
MPGQTLPHVPRPRVGVDSYAYHRLLGEVRPGEQPVDRPFARGSLDVIAEARALELDFAMLQTSFLGPPALFAAAAYLDEAAGLPLALSWGAPEGLAFGDRPEAVGDLIAWAAFAMELGLPVMRIVAGGPRHRGRPTSPLVPLLRAACHAASELGLTLALENHGDLSAEALERLLEQVGDAGLRICFDTANALRVGDDVAGAARRLSRMIDVIHVKDCAGSWEDAAAGPLSVPPGEGVIPLDEVLDICAEALACVEVGQLPPLGDELALVAATVHYIRSR